jgi:hypothetical protein
MMIYPWLAPYAVAKTFVNSWFDHVFYDVNCLSEQERQALPGMLEVPQLINVYPKEMNQPIRLFTSLDTFRKSPDRPTAFVLAGAVASSLGGVALARNVADTLGRSVCFILPSALESTWSEQWTAAWVAPSRPFASDSDLLVEILEDPDLKVDFVLGHSRGCLRVADALSRCPASPDCEVVTVGGVVDLPEAGPVRQILGAYDWLGAANSRLDLDHQVVPASGHHLNPQLPFALNLSEVLPAQV